MGCGTTQADALRKREHKTQQKKNGDSRGQRERHRHREGGTETDHEAHTDTKKREIDRRREDTGMAGTLSRTEGDSDTKGGVETKGMGVCKTRERVRGEREETREQTEGGEAERGRKRIREETERGGRVERQHRGERWGGKQNLDAEEGRD